MPKVSLNSPTLVQELAAHQQEGRVAGMHVLIDIPAELAELFRYRAMTSSSPLFHTLEAEKPEAFKQLRRYLSLMHYTAWNVRTNAYMVKIGRIGDNTHMDETVPSLMAHPAGRVPEWQVDHGAGQSTHISMMTDWQTPSAAPTPSPASSTAFVSSAPATPAWVYTPRVKRVLPAWMKGTIGDNFTGNIRAVVQVRGRNALAPVMMDTPISALNLTTNIMAPASPSSGASQGVMPITEHMLNWARGRHVATAAYSHMRNAEMRTEAVNIMTKMMEENPDLFQSADGTPRFVSPSTAYAESPWSGTSSFWSHHPAMSSVRMVTTGATTTMCFGTRSEQEQFINSYGDTTVTESIPLGAYAGLLPCVVTAWRRLSAHTYDSISISEGRHYAIGRNLLCVPLSLPTWRSASSRVAFEGVEPNNTAIWAWFMRAEGASVNAGAGDEALPLAVVTQNINTRTWSIYYLKGVVHDCPLTASQPIDPSLIVESPTSAIHVEAKNDLLALGVSKAAATRALHLSFRIATGAFAKALGNQYENGRVSTTEALSSIDSFCAYGLVGSEDNSGVQVYTRSIKWLSQLCSNMSFALSSVQRNALAGQHIGSYLVTSFPTALGDAMTHSRMIANTQQSAQALHMATALWRGIHVPNCNTRRAVEMLGTLNTYLVNTSTALHREVRTTLRTNGSPVTDPIAYRFVYCPLTQRIWLRLVPDGEAANDGRMVNHPSASEVHATLGVRDMVMRCCVGCGTIVTIDCDLDVPMWWSPATHETEAGEICGLCRQTNYDTCECCGQASLRTNMFRTATGGRACNSCAPHYRRCTSCNTLTHENEHEACNGMCSRCHAEAQRELRQRESMPFGGYHQTRRNGSFFTERNADPKDKSIPLGVELEVCCTGDHRDDVLHELGKKGYGHYFIAERDGSLSDERGVEFVSAPMTRSMWECVLSGKPTPHGHSLNVCADMLGYGVRGYNVKGNYGTYGIHISVARHRLTPLQEARILAFLLAKNNTAFVQAIAQRASIYGSGKQIGSGYNERDTFRNGKLGGLHQEYMGDKLVKKPAGYGKYCPVNYKGTSNGMPALAEFRIFQSTLNEASFRKNLEFVWALLDWVQQPSGGSVSHTDFCAWLGRPENRKQYPNLVAYLMRDEYSIKGAKRVTNTWFGHINPPKKDRREPAVDEESIEDAPTTMTLTETIPVVTIDLPFTTSTTTSSTYAVYTTAR